MSHVDNGGCPGNGWSIISSAPTNPQLAGVLAGFVFTGIIIIFGRPGPKNTQTLSLFTATFVALGFDSYLFSLISGGTSDPACTRVWSEAMAASGLLAVGAVALMGGIAWLLADHVSAESIAGGDHHKGLVNIARLSRFMLLGVAIAAALLLAATTKDFLEIAFGGRVTGWIAWLVPLSPLAIGVTAWAWLARRRLSAEHNQDRASAVATRTLTVAVYGLFLYAIVSTVYAGILVTFPTTWWTSRPHPTTWTSLIVGLLLADLLIVALTLAGPPVLVRSRHDTEQRSDDASAESTNVNTNKDPRYET